MKQTADQPENRAADLSPDEQELFSLLLHQSSTEPAETTRIPTLPAAGAAPLSFGQERFWFLHEFDAGSPAYNVPIALRLAGKIDFDALERSVQSVVERHAILRTRFSSNDGNPTQEVVSPNPVRLQRVALGEFAADQRASEAVRLATAEARRPFDLSSGSLLRAQLWSLEPDDHLLLLVTHHLVADGFSLFVLMRELSACYRAFVCGEAPDLPPLPIQYADFARWQRRCYKSADESEHRIYWKRQLAGAPNLDLPTDQPRPALQSMRGRTLRFVLPRKLAEALRTRSQHEGVTLFMTLLAAWKVVLHRCARQNDILVGTAASNRSFAETEPLVGCFSNTLVLRTRFEGDPTFKMLLHQLRDVALEAYAHQELPFETILETLQVQRDLSRNPLFQVMFILHEQEPVLDLPGVTATRIPIELETARFDLSLDIWPCGGELVGSLEYSTDLFEIASVERLIDRFKTVLEGVVADVDEPISRFPLLSPEERHWLEVECNRTEAAVEPVCVHELFERAAAEHGQAIAVTDGRASLTYDELNQRADFLALQLREQGTTEGGLVGICLERTPDLPVALLAVLKAGGAYVPLDPGFPSQRLASMIEDSGVQLAIVDVFTEGIFDRLPVKQIRIDRSSGSANNRSAAPVPRQPIDPEQLAYVIYTSGSTGKPKGVQVPHRAVVNFLCSMRREPGLDSTDTLLAVTTISFDIAALEIFLPLICGATVMIASRETAIDPRRLIPAIESSKATVMQATPATWRMLIDAGWHGNPQLKVLCGGEALSGSLATALLPRCRELWNLYGPTETTIWSACTRIESGADPVPIGRPIANTQLYILDDALRLAPIGVPGELHIGGAGLAHGYLNRQELTEEKFVANPFEAGTRLYKTGDLARYRADGQLECLGRLDHQVKIRGFRIELGEVESVLNRHPDVRQSVVVARHDASGELQLVGYFTARNESAPEPDALRRHLKTFLPDYMVPSSLLLLSELPLTANGKIDRKALPEPGPAEPVSRGYVAPRDAIEIQLAKIWANLFHLDRVGIDDNFFDLGGHSLMAVRLFSELEKVAGRSLPLSFLFQAPSVRQLAAKLREQGCARSWNCLVPLRPEGTKPPFFLIHAVGGNLLNYRDLIQCLDPDQPVFGLQSRGLDGKSSPLTQIEEMAAAYIAEIEQLQPSGPYRIGGTSFGGVVAYEMARQWSERGATVGLLALFDSIHLNYQSDRLRMRSRWRRVCDRVQFHSRNLLYGPDRLGYIRSRIAIARRRISRKVRNRSWEVAHEYFERTGKPLPATLYRVNDANYYALRKYVPRPYAGKITFFRSIELSVAASHDIRAAWQHLARGGLEIHDVPGNHVTSMYEPHAHTLAAKLQLCLDRDMPDPR